MIREVERTRVGTELRRAVVEFGVERVRAPSVLRSILSDRLGADAVSMRPEVDLVCAAATAGVPAALDDAGGADRDALRRRVEAAGGEPAGAEWAVLAWASALGVDAGPALEPAPTVVPSPPPQAPVAASTPVITASPTPAPAPAPAPALAPAPAPAEAIPRGRLATAIVIVSIVVAVLGAGTVVASLSTGSEGSTAASGSTDPPATPPATTSAPTTTTSATTTTTTGVTTTGTNAARARAAAEAELMKRAPTTDHSCAALTGDLGPKFEALLADGRSLGVDDPLGIVRCTDPDTTDAVSDFLWFDTADDARTAFDAAAGKVLGPGEAVGTTATVSGGYYPANYFAYESTDGSATAVMIRTDEEPNLVWAFSLTNATRSSVLARLLVADL